MDWGGPEKDEIANTVAENTKSLVTSSEGFTPHNHLPPEGHGESGVNYSEHTESSI